jgi:hypothetical protein
MAASGLTWQRGPRNCFRANGPANDMPAKPAKPRATGHGGNITHRKGRYNRAQVPVVASRHNLPEQPRRELRVTNQNREEHLYRLVRAAGLVSDKPRQLRCGYADPN